MRLYVFRLTVVTFVSLNYLLINTTKTMLKTCKRLLEKAACPSYGANSNVKK